MIKNNNKLNVFIKFLCSSGICSIIDISIFYILVLIFKNNYSNYILISTIISRLISSLINYLLNRNKVFKYKNGNIDIKTLIKYYILVFIQMFISSSLVTNIYNIIKINETIIKCIVDGLIYIVNYFIQKKFIFKKKNHN